MQYISLFKKGRKQAGVCEGYLLEAERVSAHEIPRVEFSL